MLTAHLHLAINHLPVIGFLIFALIGIYSLYVEKNECPKLFLWGIMLLGLASIIVFFTGSFSEDFAAEKFSNIEDIKDSIENHEFVSGFFLAGAITIGVSSATILFYKKLNQENNMILYIKVLIVLSFIVFIFSSLTAWFGGMIRHTEFYLQ